jgi:hypothetical protein
VDGVDGVGGVGGVGGGWRFSIGVALTIIDDGSRRQACIPMGCPGRLDAPFRISALFFAER